MSWWTTSLKRSAQQRLEHGRIDSGVASFGAFGNHVEPVRIQPAWAAADLFGIDSPGGADQIHHRGPAHFVPGRRA